MHEKQISEKMNEIISHIFEKYFGAVISIKNKLMSTMLILLLVLPVTFLGCSSGGGDDPPAPRPSIQVLPSSYNFGIITPGNVPVPLEVQIVNNGGKRTLSDITLSDTTNFDLDLSAGSNPCLTASSTILSGGYCTLVVDFIPTGFGSFTANLTVESDDPVAPKIKLPLSGTNDDSITELNVRINQVESTEICPNPVVTAYVSVTDQGGYSVPTLSEPNFLITEQGVNLGAPTAVSSVSVIGTISVALVMDYSGSITDIKDSLTDLQESAKSFVDLMGPSDETEIIKFDEIYDVVQPFTSVKDDLKAAIDAPWDYGRETVFYDAVWQAVQDTIARNKDRRAVIVITDGEDTISSNGLIDVIDLAKNNGVPVFTIGYGQLNEAILQQMADETSGQYYQASTSDNLKTIYQQLANLLYYDQYVLTYSSGLGVGVSANLTIEATLAAIVGNDTTEITSCP